MQTVVLDTNIVLDLFVFDDEAVQLLKQQLEDGEMRWLAMRAMRDELERVLAYPKIAPRVAFHGRDTGKLLAEFDRRAEMVDAAPKAGVTCKDADDQKFIDLAIAHSTLLLSKDAAVLTMKKRLAAFGVRTGQRLEATQ